MHLQFPSCNFKNFANVGNSFQRISNHEGAGAYISTWNFGPWHGALLFSKKKLIVQNSKCTSPTWRPNHKVQYAGVNSWFPVTDKLKITWRAIEAVLGIISTRQEIKLMHIGDSTIKMAIWYMIPRKAKIWNKRILQWKLR